MMENFFGKLAEQKMKEAIARGALNNLPAAGKPVRIQNFYFLPPEFKFAYTVLKNSGYLKLAQEENVPVSSISHNINLLNVNHSISTKIIQEKPSVSKVNDEMNTSNVIHSNPKKHVLEKTFNYIVIRDSRRRRY